MKLFIVATCDDSKILVVLAFVNNLNAITWELQLEDCLGDTVRARSGVGESSCSNDTDVFWLFVLGPPLITVVTMDKD